MLSSTERKAAWRNNQIVFGLDWIDKWCAYTCTRWSRSSSKRLGFLHKLREFAGRWNMPGMCVRYKSSPAWCRWRRKVVSFVSPECETGHCIWSAAHLSRIMICIYKNLSICGNCYITAKDSHISNHSQRHQVLLFLWQTVFVLCRNCSCCQPLHNTRPSWPNLVLGWFWSFTIRIMILMTMCMMIMSMSWQISLILIGLSVLKNSLMITTMVTCQRWI